MPPQQAADYSKFYIPAAIVLAGVIIGVSLVIALKPASGTSGDQPTVAVDIKDVKITADDPYIGDKNAPVTIAYWSDYQCPFCKAVEVGGVPQLTTPPAIPDVIKQYVDTGKVRIVFKDYPFLGEDSITAALYEHAIWNLYPTRFYEWREAMFKAQDDEGDEGFGDEASIVALIQKLGGMDTNKLKADVAANKDAYTALMDDDKSEGARFGIQGTPGFITGKTIIPGLVPFSEFKSSIDAQL